jgi:hypothetical protein
MRRQDLRDHGLNTHRPTPTMTSEQAAGAGLRDALTHPLADRRRGAKISGL